MRNKNALQGKKEQSVPRKARVTHKTKDSIDYTVSSKYREKATYNQLMDLAEEIEYSYVNGDNHLDGNNINTIFRAL